MLALMYNHIPVGFKPPPPKQRLRSWEGDSPYFAGRPLRGPRGSAVLLPEHRPITFRTIPKLEGVTVHSMASEASASNESAYLHVASMAIQAMTGKRVVTHKAKRPVLQWGLKKNRFVSVTADLKGEEMYNFLSKTVDMVMPRMKEWKGVAGSSGDSAGNITFGLRPEDVILYPEVEVNYDM
jgi:large subunit ribosomal protein L5